MNVGHDRLIQWLVYIVRHVEKRPGRASKEEILARG